MTTLLVTHPDVIRHDMGPGHPERPDRIRVVLDRLGTADFDALLRAEAPEVTRDAILRVHPAAYLDALLDARPRSGERTRLDADTSMNDGTWPAVMRAAGGAVHAVDAVLDGLCRNAFVAVRPPGHHAERVHAMGFCFLNGAAIAARHAQAERGIGRVAIVDFDVHHGNGTQDIFWDDSSVLYCSTHEMPLYPGTGASSERGTQDSIVNVPLAAGADGATFRGAIDNHIVPRLIAFAPELLILSAGFDAHRRDPLANLKLVEDDFAWVTRRLIEATRASTKGRVVSILEGGYDLEALAASAAAHVTVLMADGST